MLKWSVSFANAKPAESNCATAPRTSENGSPRSGGLRLNNASVPPKPGGKRALDTEINPSMSDSCDRLPPEELTHDETPAAADAGGKLEALKSSGSADKLDLHAAPPPGARKPGPASGVKRRRIV